MANVDLNVRVGVTPKNPFDDILDSVDALKGQFSGLTSGFTKLTGAIAGIAAVAGSFDFIVDATRNAETLTTSFKRFTSSAEEAENQLRELQSIPGPSLNELASANRTLLAFGISLDDSITLLKQLNDVSAGTGAKVEDLAEIFGKVTQEGNLTNETFKKLSNQIPGFSRQLATALDLPERSLKRLASEGQISADQLAKAFKDMTSEGGQFFESAADQAKTLNGSFSALADSSTALAAELGKSLTPAITTSNNAFVELLDTFTLWIRTARQNTSDPVSQRLNEIRNQLNETTVRLKDFQDIAGQSSGVKRFLDVLAAGGETKLSENIKQLTKDLQNLIVERNKILEGMDSETAAKAAADNQKKINKAVIKEQDKFDEEMAVRRQKQNDELFKAAEQRGAAIQASMDNINKIVEQEAAVQSQILKAQQDQALQDQKKAAEKAALEAQIAAEGRLTLNQTIAAQESLFQLEQAQAADDMLTAQRLESLILREQELTAARMEAEAARLELLGQFDEAEILRQDAKNKKLLEAQSKAESDRLKVIQKAKADEFNFAKISAEQEKKFQEATLLGRLSLISTALDAFASLSRSKNRELANIGKAAALFQIGISIPEAAQKAYTSASIFGPVAGTIAAAAATAAGFIRLEQVRSQQVAFAEGGVVPGTGNKDTVLSLLTPGEVVVPQKNFDQIAQDMAFGSVSSDQVQLLTQSNALTSKILEQITAGVIIEKLTIVIGLLSDLKSISISSASSRIPSNADPVPTVVVTTPASRGPRTVDRRDLQQVEDRRA